MDLGNRIHTLWRLRAGVVASLLLALLAAVWSVQKVSLSPFELTPRALEMASASTHVLVDTPQSTLLDLRQDTYSLEALTNRAVLLGNVMATDPVRSRIARRAGLPPEALVVEAPLTRQQPRPRVEAGQEKKMSDLLKSMDQYRLSIQANPTVPVLDLYSQTPDTKSAKLLADAAVDELRSYLTTVATDEQIPDKSQIRLVQLGRAEGSVINGEIHWQVAFLAFILTFVASCATVLFVARVRDGWRLAARLEQPAA